MNNGIWGPGWSVEPIRDTFEVGDIEFRTGWSVDYIMTVRDEFAPQPSPDETTRAGDVDPHCKR